MPSLTVRLLGPFELFVGGAPVSAERWLRRKPRSLVKLLALQPRRQLHREQIIDLLWPDADFESAANNLHKAIHAARRAIEPDLKSGSRSRFVLIRDNLVALCAPGGVHVDVEAFESKAAAALRSDNPGLFEAALDLYRGDLLPEDLYEDWAAVSRERLRGLYGDLLFRFAQLREECGDYADGVGLLRSLVDADPTNEEAHRRLMRLQALTGNRLGAFQQYRQLVQVLRSDAGVEPDRTTVELYDSISAQTANGPTPQKEVTREMAEKLYLSLNGAGKQPLDGYETRNDEALELYLKGRYCWGFRSGERMLQAVRYYEQAIAKDPGYALAWCGMADACNHLAMYGILPSNVACKKAMDAVKRALELAPNLAEAHAAKGYLQATYLWDYDAACKSFRRASEMKPRDPLYQQWFGNALISIYRDVDTGFPALRRSLQLDPVGIVNRATLGWLLYFVSRLEEAVDELKHAIELDPNIHVSHLFLGRIYWQEGMFEESIDSFRRAVAASKGDAPIQTELIAALAMAGDRDEALRLLDEKQSNPSEKYSSSYFLALIHLALGDDQKTLDLLEVAYRERATQLMWLNVEPRFQRLREYPRFRDLLRRIGY
jgi:DNA-binding SARP family transcriptional activator/Tfp pilus assembly protein PilF